jgi:thioredoxin reductase (NADPH)
MVKPTIFAVDYDLVTLKAVDRDLHQKYGRDYRVLKSSACTVALGILRKLKLRGEALALLLVDQSMPDMTGIQFIEEALKIFPAARKVLLIAYTDTETANYAIREERLDDYLLKPWDPLTGKIFPVLDRLLEEWWTNYSLTSEDIRLVGSMESARCHDVKDFLQCNGIPFRWLDIDKNREAKTLLRTATLSNQNLPVLFFPNGEVLVQPSQQEVAGKVGLRTRATKPFYDVIVIGGGPAGLSTAVIASADGLKVLLIERHAPGGQARNSPKIENFLGFPSGISGQELTRRAVAQAMRFGAEIITTQSVTHIRSEGLTKTVILEDGSEISAKIVLIATGAWFRPLDLPGIEHWHGAGVYYGGVQTEASNFRDQDIVVIGAANAAAQGVLYLSKYAHKVTVLIRDSQPSWSKYLDVVIRPNPKIELQFNAELTAFEGEKQRKEVKIRHTENGEITELPTGAVFVFIGQQPQSDFIADLVLRSPSGHILTGLDLVKDGKRPAGWSLARDPLMLETSVPGIFAAGDVRNGTMHGIAAAAGDGNSAVSMFWQYLSMI